MSKNKKNDNKAEDIRLLITYGVEERERQKALKFLEKSTDNPMVLAVLEEFYSTLPGAMEEAVIGVVMLAQRQGIYLLGVATLGHKYLYLYNEERTGCLGTLEEGIDDKEILLFFNLSSKEEFQKKYPSFEGLEDLTSIKSQKVYCPVCGVEEGEYHILGCAVEVCPWCDGQLSKCGCRFDEMKVEEFESEEELVAFEEHLEAKGRVCFSGDQSPAYPEDRKSRGNLED